MKITGGLKLVPWYQPHLNSDVDQDSTMFSDKCRKVSVNTHSIHNLHMYIGGKFLLAEGIVFPPPDI